MSTSSAPRTGWLAALLAGCAGGFTDQEARQAWLVEAIADDNRVWLSREPELLAAKYAVMAEDPYDFLRGSAAVSLADWSRPGSDRLPSARPGSSKAATVLLMGDPHPENVGTYLPGDRPEPTDHGARVVLDVEFTDFDGAGYGPWTLDVRRAAQSLALLAAQSACDVPCARSVVTAFADAYTDEIATRARRRPGFASGTTGGGEGPTDALVREAIVEGLGRSRLLGWTRHTEGGRRFAYQPDLDLSDQGNRPLTPDEADQVDRLLATWPRARGLHRLDATRRLGMGVASIPAIRYAVLFDGGLPGFEDDHLVMFREVVDPPQLPGLHRDPRLLWDDNGARVVDAARRLWSRPDADPWMAAITDGDTTFKVVTGSSFQEGFDHVDLRDDAWRAPDPATGLGEVASTLGRVLASAHGRGGTWDGGDSLAAIDEDLGDARTFVDETVHLALMDAERLLEDHALFVDALDRLGPLLGADQEVPTW